MSRRAKGFKTRATLVCQHSLCSNPKGKNDLKVSITWLNVLLLLSYSIETAHQ